MKLDELIEYSRTHWDEYRLRWSKLEDKGKPCSCGAKLDHECLDCWNWFCSDCIPDDYKSLAKEFYATASNIPYCQVESVDAVDRWQWTCSSCLRIRMDA